MYKLKQKVISIYTDVAHCSSLFLYVFCCFMFTVCSFMSMLVSHVSEFVKSAALCFFFLSNEKISFLSNRFMYFEKIAIEQNETKISIKLQPQPKDARHTCFSICIDYEVQQHSINYQLGFIIISNQWVKAEYF